MTDREWLYGPNVAWIDSSGSDIYDFVQVTVSDEIRSSAEWLEWLDSNGLSSMELTLGISVSGMNEPGPAKRRRVGSELRVSVNFHEPGLPHMDSRQIWELAHHHLVEGFRQAGEMKGVTPTPDVRQLPYKPLLAPPRRLFQIYAWEDHETPMPSVVEQGQAQGGPSRFTIRPDDYHVPYAGTAQDGRQFFLSQELLSYDGCEWVGLFLWRPDGTFDEADVRQVGGELADSAAQGSHGTAGGALDERLARLGEFVLEPITVEPFTTVIEGIEFGWKLKHENDSHTVNVEPGDFICYYPPWDGFEYDT